MASLKIAGVPVFPSATPPSSLRRRLGDGMVVCSSRPQKKSTAHHIKTRPKKTQQWDIKRRGPTPYPPLPALPPDWTIVEAAEDQPPPPPQEAEPVAVAEPEVPITPSLVS